MNRAQHFAVIATVATALATLGFAASAQVRMDDILKDASSTGDVLTVGLGPQGQRYSPLNLANRDTASRIVPGWSLPLGIDGPRWADSPQQPQSQPLVRDGILYFGGADTVRALDTRDGRQIWRYDHPSAEVTPPCCDATNRGLALLGDKIFATTRDSKLMALNTKSGAVVWTADIEDQRPGHAELSAPLIVPSKAHGALVVTGVTRGEFGVVGRVEARRVDTGALVWSRPTIEGHLGVLAGKPATMTGKPGDTWPDDMWMRRGGATWLGGTYDPETRLIFVGTGAPAPSSASSPAGERKWSRSRIAIDPETGTIRWGFQTTPSDGHDYDGVNEVVSFDLDGQKAVATADRNGFFYVLDRARGSFISAFPFVSKINWARGIDKAGRPIPEPARDARAAIVPSPLGGKNWMPMAYSRDTKLFYVPSNEWGLAAPENVASPTTAARSAPKPMFETHVGSLKALDPTSGQIVWEYRHRGPLWGGVLATAGGLVLFGTPEGELKALDAATGQDLWTHKTGGSIVSSPITWLQDGEQMFAVVVSPAGHGPLAVPPPTQPTTALANAKPPIAKPTPASLGPTLWTFRLPKEFVSTSN